MWKPIEDAPIDGSIIVAKVQVDNSTGEFETAACIHFLAEMDEWIETVHGSVVYPTEYFELPNES